MRGSAAAGGLCEVAHGRSSFARFPMPQRCEARRVCSPPGRPPGWEGERWGGAVLCPVARLSLAPSARSLQEEDGNCAVTVIITLCFRAWLWSSALWALSFRGVDSLLRFPALWSSCLSHISEQPCVQQHFSHPITSVPSLALVSPLFFSFFLCWHCSGGCSVLG